MHKRILIFVLIIYYRIASENRYRMALNTQKLLTLPLKFPKNSGKTNKI